VSCHLTLSTQSTEAFADLVHLGKKIADYPSADDSERYIDAAQRESEIDDDRVTASAMGTPAFASATDLDGHDSPKAEILTEDSSIIRCICPYDDDDGFTIQCERCFVWQHALCVGISQDNVPEEYLCERCSPRIVFVDQATQRQTIRRRAEEGIRRARSDMDGDDMLSEARDFAVRQVPVPDKSRQMPTKHAKRRSIPLDDYGQADVASQKRTQPKRRMSSIKGKNKPVSTATNHESSAGGNTVDNGDDSGFDESYEPWQFEYTPIASNTCGDPSLRDRLLALTNNRNSRRRPRRRHRRAATSASLDGSNAVVQFINPPHVPEFDRLPKPASTIVKAIPHSSPSFFAPCSNPLGAPLSGGSVSTPYPRPTIHALFSSSAISAGSFICEARGELIALDRYRSDPVNQYSTLGVLKPMVRAVGRPWSLAIDQRLFSNESRFIRSGCHPNAVVKPVVLTRPQGGSSNASSRATSPGIDSDSSAQQRLVFGVFATTDIGRREEIVLPWDWDDDHALHSLPSLLSTTSPEDLSTRVIYDVSQRMASISTTLLGIVSCACEKRNDCGVAWMWKIASASFVPNKTGLSRREVFEGILTNGTTKEETEKWKGKTAKGKAKRADLGPLLGIHRGWFKTGETEPEATEDESEPEDLGPRDKIARSPPDEGIALTDEEARSSDRPSPSVDLAVSPPIPPPAPVERRTKGTKRRTSQAKGYASDASSATEALSGRSDDGEDFVSVPRRRRRPRPANMAKRRRMEIRQRSSSPSLAAPTPSPSSNSHGPVVASTASRSPQPDSAPSPEARFSEEPAKPSPSASTEVTFSESSKELLASIAARLEQGLPLPFLPSATTDGASIVPPEETVDRENRTQQPPDGSAVVSVEDRSEVEPEPEVKPEPVVREPTPPPPPKRARLSLAEYRRRRSENQTILPSEPPTPGSPIHREHEEPSMSAPSRPEVTPAESESTIAVAVSTTTAEPVNDYFPSTTTEPVNDYFSSMAPSVVPPTGQLPEDDAATPVDYTPPAEPSVFRAPTTPPRQSRSPESVVSSHVYGTKSPDLIITRTKPSGEAREKAESVYYAHPVNHYDSGPRSPRRRTRSPSRGPVYSPSDQFSSLPSAYVSGERSPRDGAHRSFHDNRSRTPPFSSRSDSGRQSFHRGPPDDRSRSRPPSFSGYRTPNSPRSRSPFTPREPPTAPRGYSPFSRNGPYSRSGSAPRGGRYPPTSPSSSGRGSRYYAPPPRSEPPRGPRNARPSWPPPGRGRPPPAPAAERGRYDGQCLLYFVVPSAIVH
jgi:hypothetical protein